MLKHQWLVPFMAILLVSFSPQISFGDDTPSDFSPISVETPEKEGLIYPPPMQPGDGQTPPSEPPSDPE